MKSMPISSIKLLLSVSTLLYKMSTFQQRIMRQLKKQLKTKNCKETKQTTEPDSDMTQMLELSDKEFKIAMINMLKTLIEKEDNMQVKMGNFSK